MTPTQKGEREEALEAEVKYLKHTLAIEQRKHAKCRREKHALLSSAAAEAKMREALEWQPIATAPTDGTVIDLWLGGDEDPHRRTDCYWGRPHHECGEAGRYCDCCPPDRDMWVDPLSGGYEDLSPTHWMRPPAAPAALSKEPS